MTHLQIVGWMFLSLKSLTTAGQSEADKHSWEILQAGFCSSGKSKATVERTDTLTVKTQEIFIFLSNYVLYITGEVKLGVDF